MSSDLPSSAFKATRLTGTTFLIKEYNDIFSEWPHIYVKIVHSANTIVIVDTGCGGRSKDPTVEITSLRVFMETYPVQENANQPLNPAGSMGYVVVTTHCHYDHILGVEQFLDSQIVASSYKPSFLSPGNLAEHSLCEHLGLQVPRYSPILVHHHHKLCSPTEPKQRLGMTVLHTPGHTPDQLALYDADEGMLYVGDTFYERERIIFPNEGSIIDWFKSIDYLISFVKLENDSGTFVKEREVMINAGHSTALRPALLVLEGAKAFLRDVVEGREQVKRRQTVRGECHVTFDQATGQFCLRCPERLIKEAQDAMGNTKRSM